MSAPVGLGLSFPISFWALSPQGRGNGAVKTQEDMSLPFKVYHREPGEGLPMTHS